MIVGLGKLILDFYNNTNLAVKHRQIEELCVGLRKQFNLSILEVADFEDPERCVIGFAAVMPENWKTQSARSFIEKICKTADETAFARIVVEDWDLHHF